MIFQFYTLTPLFSTLFRKVDFRICIPVALAVNILIKQYALDVSSYLDSSIVDFYVCYNDRIFISYIVYWVIGGYAGTMYPAFKSKLLNNTKSIYTAGIVIVLFHTGLSYYSYLGTLEYRYAEIVHVIFCIASITCIYRVSFALEALEIGPLKNLVTKYSHISYYVYLSHVLFIYIVDNAMNDASIEKIYTRWIIRTAFAFATSGIVAIILTSPKWKRVKAVDNSQTLENIN